MWSEQTVAETLITESWRFKISAQHDASRGIDLSHAGCVDSCAPTVAAEQWRFKSIRFASSKLTMLYRSPSSSGLQCCHLHLPLLTWSLLYVLLSSDHLPRVLWLPFFLCGPVLSTIGQVLVNTVIASSGAKF